MRVMVLVPGNEDSELRSYPLLPSVRGDLLAKLGLFGEASAELERAASLAQNARERELLLCRARECQAKVGDGRGTP